MGVSMAVLHYDAPSRSWWKCYLLKAACFSNALFFNAEFKTIVMAYSHAIKEYKLKEVEYSGSKEYTQNI